MTGQISPERVLLPRDAAWFDACPLPEAVHPHVAAFDIPGLVDLVIERCASTVFAQHHGDADFVAALRASVTQNAYALRDVLLGTHDLAGVELDRVLHFASVQARLHIPQKSMQRSYRVSFFTQWELWTAHLRERLQDPAAELDAAEVLSQLTRVLLTYQDHVASQVAETYTRDQQALNRSRAHVRRSLVRDLLRGEAAEMTASDLAILAYPLHASHVAVLLPDMTEGAASSLSEALRTASHSHEKLVYPVSMSSTVVWLCRLEPWQSVHWEGLTDVLGRVGATASIGDAEAEVDGFARTLEQARETERVRARWGAVDSPPVMRYADAGLEILLTQDEKLARSFVTTELGPLAETTAEARRLRETLEASFRCGSHVAAAQQLELHEHTVRNRLHRAEELLGRSLQDRRVELQVAVRLMRMLESPAE